MHRSDTKSIKILSNPNFYKKIIQKYQAGKRNISRFPMMIFCKERRDFVPKKISLILKFRLYLDKQNILSSLILKKKSAIKEMLPNLNTGKNTLQLIVKSINIQDTDNITNIFPTALEIPQMCQIASGVFPFEHVPINRVSGVPSLKSLCFRVENLINGSNKILKLSILALNANFHQKATSPIYSTIETVCSKLSKYEKNIENFYSKIFRKEINNISLNIANNLISIDNENKLKHKPVFKHESLAICLEKQINVLSLIEKDVFVVKRKFSSGAKKHAFQPIVKTKSTINTAEVMNVFPKTLKITQMYQIELGRFSSEPLSTSKALRTLFLKSLIHRAEKTLIGSSKTLKMSIPALKAAFYLQTANTIYPDRAPVNSQILNYRNNMETLNSHIFKEKINRRSLNLTRHFTFINEGNTLKNQSMFEDKLSAILLKANLVFDNKNPIFNSHLFKKSNRETGNKPLIKNYYGGSGYGESSHAQRAYTYKIDYKNLFFHDQGHLEQEIEQIKKIMIETKESLLEKPVPVSGEADIRRGLDINRISDQVYRNIERTIRMEKERRGI